MKKKLIEAVGLIRAIVVLPIFLVLVAGFCWAQEQAPAGAPSGEEPQGSLNIPVVEPQTEEFKKATEDLRAHLKKMHKSLILFNVSETPQEDAKHKRDWNEMATSGIEIHNKFIEAALKEYLLDPKGRPEIADMLYGVLERNVEKDRFEGMVPVVVALVENDYPSPDLIRLAAMTTFAMGEFEKCKPYLERLVADGVASEQLLEINSQFDTVLADWNDELRLREEDAKGEPLPRALIRTTKGDIVIELFENQAPESVGNFVSLVEDHFYDDLLFHRVIEHFMAQGGCPIGDGTGGPGYMIYNEAQKPDARKIWRGSVAYALAEDPDTGGSQFFINFLPVPPLNGQFTVFGRVISGMEVAASLNRVDEDNKEKSKAKEGEAPVVPDAILSIEMLSKRDHEYKPRKVE